MISRTIVSFISFLCLTSAYLICAVFEFTVELTNNINKTWQVKIFTSLVSWPGLQQELSKLSGDTPIAPPIMAPTPNRDRGHSSLVAILGLAPIPVADPVAGMLGSCGHNG